MSDKKFTIYPIIKFLFKTSGKTETMAFDERGRLLIIQGERPFIATAQQTVEWYYRCLIALYNDSDLEEVDLEFGGVLYAEWVKRVNQEMPGGVRSVQFYCEDENRSIQIGKGPTNLLCSLAEKCGTSPDDFLYELVIKFGMEMVSVWKEEFQGDQKNNWWDQMAETHLN